MVIAFCVFTAFFVAIVLFNTLPTIIRRTTLALIRKQQRPQ